MQIFDFAELCIVDLRHTVLRIFFKSLSAVYQTTLTTSQHFGVTSVQEENARELQHLTLPFPIDKSNFEISNILFM